MSSYKCVHVWDEIDDALPNGVMISHLLWALWFLKVYRMEDTVVAMVNIDTFLIKIPIAPCYCQMKAETLKVERKVKQHNNPTILENTH